VEDVEWVNLAQDMENERAVLNGLLHLQAVCNPGILSTMR
jgi:hypothetical protein